METLNTTNIPDQDKEEKKKEKKESKKKIQLERTRTAFERLQLAWIRTSLTMLTIGVGAYEFFYNRQEMGKAPLLKTITGRELGLFLIVSSFVMLLLATLQHTRSMRILKNRYTESRKSVASILSYLLLALSFVLGVMVLVEL